MAKLTDDGRVLSDDGEWLWNPNGGSIKGGSWERIVLATSKPGLATRLLVKRSAWGKPGLQESLEADRLQASAARRGLTRIQNKLEAEAERRRTK